MNRSLVAALGRLGLLAFGFSGLCGCAAVESGPADDDRGPPRPTPTTVPTTTATVDEPPPRQATPPAIESFLGVETEASRYLESQFEDEEGLAVVRVVENSPAHEAGVQVGDRILALDEREVRSPNHLDARAARLPPGSAFELEVRRDDAVLELRGHTVRRVAPRRAPPVSYHIESRRIGARVATLSTEEARRAALPPGEGVKVLSFYPGSPLPGAGVEAYDIVWKIDGEPVFGGQDFVDRLHATEPDRRLVLEILRGEARREITVRTSERSRSTRLFHLPGIVIYERDAAGKKTTFGILLNLFKYTRNEDERTYRFIYFISWTTGDNEELREVEV